jgi:DNA polymerase IV
MSKKNIMHLDVNSAFLSWHGAYLRQLGQEDDLMNIPCVIGGNEKKRHGIVLAKSIPAKKRGVKTGQSLMEARQQCPDLKVIPPRYDVYVKASQALIELLKTYTPKVDVFSIDECFMDMTGTEGIHGDLLTFAFSLKEKIKNDFGYTVNIGLSENKLLAKQASEFEKPDRVHTLYPSEIETKLWPLPVGELFMVGTKTRAKLKKIGIETIGDLAQTDRGLLKSLLKSHGELIHDYARGIDQSGFEVVQALPFKGVGNGSTLPFDVEDLDVAGKIIFSLVESAAKRLREACLQAQVISVGFKDEEFMYLARQRKLPYHTSCTQDLYIQTYQLFVEFWDGRPIRHMNVRFTELCPSKEKQMHLFQSQQIQKMDHLDATIDAIRKKYGVEAIVRGTYLESGLRPILGGYPDDEYPNMRSIL